MSVSNTKIDVKKTVVDELHKPARKNFKRRKTIIRGINETFQADLIDVSNLARYNNRHRYILLVIDVFSKFIWAVSVKTKSGKDVTDAIKRILKPPNIPNNIQTDMGTEFYNKHFRELMEKLNINHYSTFSSTKAAIAERAIRTIKSWLKY